MKATIHEAKRKLESLQLSAYDFSSDSMVRVIQEGGAGSILFFTSAFALKWKDWYLEFTEHDGNHVYHETDIYVDCFQLQSEKSLSKFRRDPRTVKYFKEQAKKLEYDNAYDPRRVEFHPFEK